MSFGTNAAIARLLALIPCPRVVTGSRASSVVEARRFAVLVSAVFFVAAYVIFDEMPRRTLLPTVMFYDQALHAMDYTNPVDQAGSPGATPGFSSRLSVEPLWSDGPPDMSSESALSDAVGIQRHREVIGPVSTVSVAGLDGVACGQSYEVEPVSRQIIAERASEPEGFLDRVLDEAFPRFAPTPTSERDWSDTVTPVGKHLLIEFSYRCGRSRYAGASESFGGAADYAMVGMFDIRGHAEATIGVLADDHNGELFFARRDALEHYLLLIVSAVTGSAYRPGGYQEALEDFFALQRSGPSVLGVSLPMGYAVLALPAIVLFLTASFFHRVRRLSPDDETPWILLDSEGLIERLCAGLWQLTLVLSSLVVLRAAELYLGPDLVIIPGKFAFMPNPERIVDSYETIVHRMGSLQVAQKLYAYSMCGLALFVMSISLHTLRCIRRRTVCVVHR